MSEANNSSSSNKEDNFQNIDTRVEDVLQWLHETNTDEDFRTSVRRDLVSTWLLMLKDRFSNNTNIVEVGCDIEEHMEPIVQISAIGHECIRLNQGEWMALSSIKVEHLLKKFQDEIIPHKDYKFNEFNLGFNILIQFYNFNNEKSIKLVKHNNQLCFSATSLLHMLSARDVINQKLETLADYFNNWYYRNFLRYLAQSFYNEKEIDDSSILSRAKFLCFNVTALINLTPTNDASVFCAITEIVNLFPKQFLKDMHQELLAIKEDVDPVLRRNM